MNSDFKHCEFKRVPLEWINDKKVFKSFLIEYLSRPFTFDLENQDLYEITNLEFLENDGDDFIKNLICIIRTISYKPNK